MRAVPEDDSRSLRVAGKGTWQITPPGILDFGHFGTDQRQRRSAFVPNQPGRNEIAAVGNHDQLAVEAGEGEVAKTTEIRVGGDEFDAAAPDQLVDGLANFCAAKLGYRAGGYFDFRRCASGSEESEENGEAEAHQPARRRRLPSAGSSSKSAAR